MPTWLDKWMIRNHVGGLRRCTECGAIFDDASWRSTERTKCFKCEPPVAYRGLQELTKEEALQQSAEKLAEEAVYRPDRLSKPDVVLPVPDEELSDLVVEVAEEHVPHLRVLAENSPDPSLRLGAQTILRSKTLARRFEKAGLPPPDAVPPAPGAEQAAGAEIGLKGAVTRAESAVDAVSPPAGAAEAAAGLIKGALTGATQAASSTGLSKTQLAVVIAIITLLAAGGGAAVLMGGSNPLQPAGSQGTPVLTLRTIKVTWVDSNGASLQTYIPVKVDGSKVSGTWSGTQYSPSGTPVAARYSFEGRIDERQITGRLLYHGTVTRENDTISYDSKIDNAILSIDGNTATSDRYPFTIRYASDKFPPPSSYTVNLKLTADLTS